jgi:hypothetical protein
MAAMPRADVTIDAGRTAPQDAAARVHAVMIG